MTDDEDKRRDGEAEYRAYRKGFEDGIAHARERMALAATVRVYEQHELDTALAEMARASAALEREKWARILRDWGNGTDAYEVSPFDAADVIEANNETPWETPWEEKP